MADAVLDQRVCLVFGFCYYNADTGNNFVAELSSRNRSSSVGVQPQA